MYIEHCNYGGLPNKNKTILLIFFIIQTFNIKFMLLEIQVVLFCGRVTLIYTDIEY